MRGGLRSETCCLFNLNGVCFKKKKDKIIKKRTNTQTDSKAFPEMFFTVTCFQEDQQKHVLAVMQIEFRNKTKQKTTKRKKRQELK